MKRESLLSLLLAGAVFLGAACAPKTNPEDDDSSNGSGGSSNGYHVIPEGEESSHIDYVDGDVIVFDYYPNFEEGDIIGAGPSSVTPNGLLKRVTDVFGTSVYTEQPTIPEVVGDGEFSLEGSTLYLEGQGLERESIVFEDIEIADNVFIDVGVNIDSDFYFDINISGGRLDTLETGLNISNMNWLNIHSSSFFETFNNNFELGSVNLHSFIAGYLPSPIPLPVVVSPRIVLNGSAQGETGELSLRLTNHSSLELGISVPDTDDTFGDIDNDFNFTTHYLENPGGISFELHGKPRLELRLYGLAGPYGEMDFYIRYDSDSSQWRVYGGGEVRGGVSAGILGNSFADYSTSVLDFENLLREEDISEVISGGTGGNPGEPNKIYFTVDSYGDNEIYSANSEGWFGVSTLTSNSADDFFPRTNADGTQIVFVSDRDGNYELYKMGSDGSNQTRLTYTSSGSFNNENAPDWSPTREEIVFDSNVSGTNKIYVMNTNGSGRHRLTSLIGSEIYPSWSPDGNKVAFSTTKSGEGHYDIYVIGRNGSGLQRVTSHSGVDIQPDWSPEANNLVFASNRSGYFDLYTINLSNNDITRLTNSSAEERFPRWSPDGTKIAYDSNATGARKVYIMDSDGSNKRIFEAVNGIPFGIPSWGP